MRKRLGNSPSMASSAEKPAAKKDGKKEKRKRSSLGELKNLPRSSISICNPSLAAF